MNTELDRLRAFRAGDAKPDPDARADARARLLEQIDMAGSGERAPARGARRRMLRPRLLVGACGLAGAAVALALALGSGGVAPEVATAAQALRAAAAVAERQPDVALQPGQFWYVRTKSFQPRYDKEGWIREDWAALDGQRRVVRRELPAGAADEDTYRGALTYSFFPRSLTHEQMLALPRDTDALYRVIERAGAIWAQDNGLPAGDRTHEMFTIVGDWLRAAPALPAALRAALYRVAARLPDVELLGDVRDVEGRAGVGVAQSDDGQRRELVFDPETSQLLSEHTVHAGSGALVYEVAYLESGVVDAIDARP